MEKVATKRTVNISFYGKTIGIKIALCMYSKHLGYPEIDSNSKEEILFFKELHEINIYDDKLALLISFPYLKTTVQREFMTTEALEQIARTTQQNLTDLKNEIPSPYEVGAGKIKQ